MAMPSTGKVELARWKSIREYSPIVGDIIIKHGWISRTKWFGIVSQVSDNGTLTIIMDGLMRLVVTMAPIAYEQHSIQLSAGDVVHSWAGTYTVMQHDPKTNTEVWFV